MALLRPAAALAGDETADFAGAFAVTIADEDVPRDLPDRATVVGRWEVAFADGTFTLSRQDVGELARGSFAIEGDRVTLRNEAGVFACPEPALYRWRLEGERLLLVLVAVEEPCAPRRLLLTTRALVAAVPCPPAGIVGATPAASEPRTQEDATKPAASAALTAAVAEGGPDACRRFAVAKAVPVVWDRVEPVVLADDAHATAVVRQTSGDHEDHGR